MMGGSALRLGLEPRLRVRVRVRFSVRSRFCETSPETGSNLRKTFMMPGLGLGLGFGLGFGLGLGLRLRFMFRTDRCLPGLIKHAIFVQ